jgi:5-(carboxyamino)imidazole ribonucleotide mutase
MKHTIHALLSANKRAKEQPNLLLRLLEKHGQGNALTYYKNIEAADGLLNYFQTFDPSRFDYTELNSIFDSVVNGLLEKLLPLVSIAVGSENDLPIMEAATSILGEMCIPFEVKIVSAHRTPNFMYEYGRSARGRYDLIIAGAGGAAHLPGMLASLTTVPVLGVPLSSKNLQGMDSLLSIVQMPTGVPVATFSIDGAANAALFAARMLAKDNIHIQKQLDEYNLRQEKKSIDSNNRYPKR